MILQQASFAHRFSSPIHNYMRTMVLFRNQKSIQRMNPQRFALVLSLSRTATEQDLRDAFAALGEVSSAAIIKDKFSGESRGFGFVEMPNKEEADKAIAGLNGKDLKGRPLTVNEARPRTDRPRTGGGGGGRGGFGGGRGRY
jgi:RNA recognition motif-containing protein